MERPLTQTQHTAADDMLDVQENVVFASPFIVIFLFFIFFLFSQSAAVLLLHVLIDYSLRALGDPAQQSANPPVIITAQPSLRGTG